mmetsp:Transcript_32058/g.61955  ORF Transcript_32058/g.61955 Transcript_32058/m.61955 type:complete len:104 (-) Transcript_32058:15-326(-)
MTLAGAALRFRGELGPTCKQFSPSELDDAALLVADDTKIEKPDASIGEALKKVEEANAHKKKTTRQRAQKIVRAFMHKLLTGKVAESDEEFPKIDENTPILFT